jgi:hypothetical protein
MAKAQPSPAWKYPLRAACDVAVMALGLLLATWPLLLIFLIFKLIF